MSELIKSHTVNKKSEDLGSTFDIEIQKKQLAENILNMLEEQGFYIEENTLKFDASSKQDIRNLHSISVKHQRLVNEKLIKKFDAQFIDRYIADGSEINPRELHPKLLTVDNDKKSRLFNWIKLHWSIPVSSGYGRRLRYIVKDECNEKVIGIIGLGDPVYALKDRDSFIGWTKQVKARKLKHVMDAFVLGSVPPYNMIRGGKLVASLVASQEIFNDFRKKYRGTKSLIRETIFNGTLAGVTTISALGKSSVYDRINIPEGSKFHHVGWTAGSGDFQFFNGYYKELLTLAKQDEKTGKNPKWGSGVRSRKTVIKKALKKLEIPTKLRYHGIRREIFFIPQGSNWKEYLCGNAQEFHAYNQSIDYLANFMKNRWMIKRSEKNSEYLKFKKGEYSLLS